MKILGVCLQALWGVCEFLAKLLLGLYLWFTPYAGHVYLAVMAVAAGSLALPGPGSVLAYQTLRVGLWIYFPAMVFTSLTVLTFGYVCCNCRLYSGIWGHLRRMPKEDYLDILMSGVCWPVSWVVIEKNVIQDYRACWMDMVAATVDYWAIGWYKGSRMTIKNPVNQQFVTFRARNADDVDRVMAEAMTAAINSESGASVVPPS